MTGQLGPDFPDHRPDVLGIPAQCLVPSPDFAQDGHNDPGYVSLSLARHESEESQECSTLLDPYDALVQANRLIRAANLVLEAQEGVASP